MYYHTSLKNKIYFIKLFYNYSSIFFLDIGIIYLCDQFNSLQRSEVSKMWSTPIDDYSHACPHRILLWLTVLQCLLNIMWKGEGANLKATYTPLPSSSIHPNLYNNCLYNDSVIIYVREIVTVSFKSTLLTYWHFCYRQLHSRTLDYCIDIHTNLNPTTS